MPSSASAAFYGRLAEATARERSRTLGGLIVNHPQSRLDLPTPRPRRLELDGLDLSPASLRALAGEEGVPEQVADLGGIDLSQASLREADLSAARLARASFEGATLRSAKLCRAHTEEARFADADLIGAAFTEARAGQADFGGAMLEDADFARVSARFASFESAVLDNVSFADADLWGASFDKAEGQAILFQGADLNEAKLRGSVLPQADFRGATLKKADLSSADLRGANFQNAVLTGASLKGANLKDAQLSGTTLQSCDIAHVFVAGAWLEKTRFGQEQLGGAIGEELAREFDAARLGYLNLEQNFRTLGNTESASWAYRRARRMGKKHAWGLAGDCWRQRRWRQGQRHAMHFAADLFVEWLCDYGESLTRVVRCFFVTFLLFAVVYWGVGSLVMTGAADAGRAPGVSGVLNFSLLTMLGGGPPQMDIVPRNTLAYFLTGVHGAVGIALIGLFGFVAGNRIRR